MIILAGNREDADVCGRGFSWNCGSSARVAWPDASGRKQVHAVAGPQQLRLSRVSQAHAGRDQSWIEAAAKNARRDDSISAERFTSTDRACRKPPERLVAGRERCWVRELLRPWANCQIVTLQHMTRG